MRAASRSRVRPASGAVQVGELAALVEQLVLLLLQRGFGQEVLGDQFFVALDGELGARHPGALQFDLGAALFDLRAQAANALLHRGRREAVDLGLLVLLAVQAFAPLGQFAKHSGLSVARARAGALARNDQQHLALPDRLPFGDAPFEHRAGLRREDLDEPARRCQVADDMLLAGVLRPAGEGEERRGCRDQGDDENGQARRSGDQRRAEQRVGLRGDGLLAELDEIHCAVSSAGR